MTVVATPASKKSTKSGKGKGKAAVSEATQPTAPVTPAAAPASAAKPEVKTIPAEVSKRVTIEDVESGPMSVKSATSTPKELRGESKRGLLLTALKTANGITMSTACTKFEWKPRDFADALRLLAKVNGVTSVRDEKGHWRVEAAAKA